MKNIGDETSSIQNFVAQFQRIGLVLLAILLFGYGVTSRSTPEHNLATALFNAVFSGLSLLLVLVAGLRKLPDHIHSLVFLVVTLAILLDAASALTTTPPYGSDSAVVPIYAAEVLLQGQNPYRAVTVSDAVQRFGLSPNFVTLLENGEPWDSYVYPAGSFLVAVPFVALGILDMRLVFLLAFIATIFIIVSHANLIYRNFIFVSFLAIYIVNNYLFLIGLVEPLIVFLLIVALFSRRHLVLSSASLGLACSLKQIAWFFVPFYLVYIMRRDGWRRGLLSTGIISSIFLATNLPFVLTAPREWISGVFGLTLVPLPALGIGLAPIGTVLNPSIPQTAYSVLALTAYLGAVVWYGLQESPNPRLAWLLPLIPLWFAWRSLTNYFFLLPLLGLGAVFCERWVDTGADVPLPAETSPTPDESSTG